MTGPVETRDRSGKRTLLVAYNGSAMSEAQLHLACRSANDAKSDVCAIYVVERPAQLPPHSPLSDEEAASVDTLQDRTERITARYGVACSLVVAFGHSVGEAVIAEAVERNARVIFIGLRNRRRPSATLLLSGTVRHILQHASCPVQIGYLPQALPEGFALEENKT
jgi:nucleotide-binding universal stress UspA family protein